MCAHQQHFSFREDKTKNDEYAIYPARFLVILNVMLAFMTA